MALITIVAGSSSDSYVSLTEANEYIANRPDATNWNNSDYKERERLLLDEELLLECDLLELLEDLELEELELELDLYQ